MRWSSAVCAGALACCLLFASSVAPSQVSSGQSPPGEASSSQSVPASPPSSSTPAPPLVLIDAAHGGAESGALLGLNLLEKDVNLALARKLGDELKMRGISASLIRGGDVALSTDQRAALANSSGATLYITLHASSQGNGMRFFTAMLPVGGDRRGPFVDWETAQSAVLPRSRWVEEQLSGAIQKTGFPNRGLMAPLRPLNSVTMPALAIEIGPTTSDVSQVASPSYQAMVCSALANALASITSQLRAGTSSP